MHVLKQKRFTLNTLTKFKTLKRYRVSLIEITTTTDEVSNFLVKVFILFAKYLKYFETYILKNKSLIEDSSEFCTISVR